jgi:hypothetical protein
VIAVWQASVWLLKPEERVQLTRYRCSIDASVWLNGNAPLEKNHASCRAFPDHVAEKKLAVIVPTHLTGLTGAYDVLTPAQALTKLTN